MLIALEQINNISNSLDEKLDKNSATVEGLDMFIQALKLQCSKFSGKNVSKFELKNFLIQFSNCTCSIKSKGTKLSLLKDYLTGYTS